MRAEIVITLVLISLASNTFAGDGNVKTGEGTADQAKIQVIEKEFYNIELVLPQRNLEQNLHRKLDLLQQLDKYYSTLAEVKSDQALPAYYKLAKAYKHFSQQISTLPVPAELSVEQIELYRAEMRKQMIEPFSKKAARLAEACIKKARDLASNEYSSLCKSVVNGGNHD